MGMLKWFRGSPGSSGRGDDVRSAPAKVNEDSLKGSRLLPIKTDAPGGSPGEHCRRRPPKSPANPADATVPLAFIAAISVFIQNKSHGPMARPAGRYAGESCP